MRGIYCFEAVRAGETALETLPMTKMLPHRSDSAPARVIAVTSGVGGAGKSCICTNLALALGSNGHRVCMLDTGPEPSRSRALWVQTLDATFQDYVYAGHSLDQILAEGPVDVGHVKAAQDIADFVHLEPGRQARVMAGLHEMEARFDYLILDIAGYIDDAQVQFLLAAPFTIVTLTPEPSSVSSAFSLLKLLKRFYYDHPVFVIVNRSTSVRIDHEIFKEFKRSTTKYLQLDVGYLGSIPKDPAFTNAKRKNMPLLLNEPDSPASHCLFGIADRLHRRLDNEVAPGTRFSAFFQKQMGETKPFGHPGVKRTSVESVSAPAPAGDQGEEDSEAGEERLALATASRYARILGPMNS